MSNKRVIIPILLIINLFVLIGFVMALHPCQTNDNVHGVYIGGECFSCNADKSDGICPDDFGNGPGSVCIEVDDIDCPRTTYAFWSEDKINEISEETFSINLINGKKLYIIVKNTGLQKDTEVEFTITELDTWPNSDDAIDVIKGIVDKNEKAVANYTITKWENLGKEEETTGYKLKFAVTIDGKEYSDILVIDTNYDAPEVMGGCYDYTEEGEEVCEDDDDGVANNSLQTTPYNKPEADEDCFYYKWGECVWDDEEEECLTKVHEAEADENPSDCTNFLSTISCEYSGEEIGDCSIEDFFTVKYTNAPEFTAIECPAWESGPIPCPRELKVPFFGLYSFIMSFIMIGLIYLFLMKKPNERRFIK